MLFEHCFSIGIHCDVPIEDSFVTFELLYFTKTQFKKIMSIAEGVVYAGKQKLSPLVKMTDVYQVLRVHLTLKPPSKFAADGVILFF